PASFRPVLRSDQGDAGATLNAAGLRSQSAVLRCRVTPKCAAASIRPPDGITHTHPRWSPPGPSSLPLLPRLARRPGAPRIPSVATPSLSDAAIAPPLRSVHTTSFPLILGQLGASVLVSTYQTGKLVALRSDDGVLNTHFRGFQRPMGLAVQGDRLAVG